MKKKLILILFILIIALTSGWFLINKISQEPIEIIVDKEITPLKGGVKGVEENLNQPEKTEEEIGEKNIPIEKDFDQKTISKNQEEQKTPITTKEASFIINKKVNWGYTASSQRNIDTIVIHSSYDALGDEPYDLDGLIKEYQQYGVAPHFLIDRKGAVYRLVDEKNIAYHAGISQMPDGRTGVNNFSIGIELMNTKEDEYTKNQYSNLNKLIEYLEDQFNIKYILGHQNISPNRKTDPWNFDWNEVESNKSVHN